MKKFLSYLTLAAFAMLSFSACNDNDGGNETPVYGHYTYDGEKKEIKSAAYHLKNTDGYNIVFSDQAGVTFTADFGDRTKNLFSIDMPYGKTGSQLDFATDNIGGANWQFYMTQWDASSETEKRWYDSDFDSGTIQVTVATDGTFEIKVDATDDDSKKLEIYYKGKPVKISNYIWAGFGS